MNRWLVTCVDSHAFYVFAVDILQAARLAKGRTGKTVIKIEWEAAQ